MFQLTIKGESSQELRAKIFEAARAFDAEVEDPNDPVVGWGEDENGDPKEIRASEVEDSDPDMMTKFDEAELPPAPVTAAFVAPQASATADGERDARGLPWDERIHAATQTKNKDGSWRNKRGIDEALIRQVESHLQQQGPAQVTQSAAPAPAPQVQAPLVAPPPVIAAPPMPTVQVDVPVFTAPPAAPAITSTPPAPSYENIPIPAQAQKPAHTFETFRANIIKVFVDLLSAGKINQDYIERLKSYFGVAETWDVKNDEVKARELFENFVSHGLITKVG